MSAHKMLKFNTKISIVCLFFYISIAHSKYIYFGNNEFIKISKIREKRGLLDVNVDVSVGAIRPIANPLGLNTVTNLLSAKTTTTPGIITTEIEATSAAPTIDNRASSSDPQCGQKVVLHTELITNGSPSKPGDWPWHAAIYKLKTTGSNQQYICGGSLISETRVVTAAHCVIENEDIILPERLFVTLGKYNLAGGDMGSQPKSVFDIVVHDDFSRVSMANDIAILKLSSKAKYTDYVQPICLWDKNQVDKSSIVEMMGTVVGWGFTESNALSQQLMKAEMPVVTDVDCIKSNPLFFSKFVTDTTFCAGFRNGTSACNGDSGGGMFFTRKGDDGQDYWYLRGIVSLSISRKDRNICDPNEYTIYTDVAKYYDFIANNL